MRDFEGGEMLRSALPEEYLDQREEDHAEKDESDPKIEQEVMQMGEVRLLRGIRQDVAPTIGIEELIEAKPGHRVIVDHFERARPDADTEEIRTFTEIEDMGETF